MANNIAVDGKIVGEGTETLPSPTLTGTISIGAVTDTVGFYGVTPAAQASLVAAVATTGVVTTGFGFSTTTQGAALIAAVNSILASLKTVGLMATT
jgi:hypothetical protein